MKITLLGTGDATGTPKIGCNCRTCRDAYNGSKSNRLRFSVLVESKEGKVLIDTSPDMRLQLLRKGIDYIDGVIWTHAHYDHYSGFGDFHRIQSKVKVYGLSYTLDYILNYLYFMKPVRHDVIFYKPFKLIGLEFTLFEVSHPPLKESAGVLIRYGNKKVAITGDTTKQISEKSIEIMKNVDVLIADAIVPPDYKVIKHMNSMEATELAKEIKAKKTIFTHISHMFPPHDIAVKNWPLGYDNMEIKLGV